MEDRCIVCDAVVPEGRQVCASCGYDRATSTKAESSLEKALKEHYYPHWKVEAKEDGIVLTEKKDQSIKADAGKPQLRLVPTEIINCIARVREFGNKKYGDSNSWRKVEKERYVDAMFRHLLKYINDNKSVDEESGLPHLWHLATNVAFLCEMEKE